MRLSLRLLLLSLLLLLLLLFFSPVGGDHPPAHHGVHHHQRDHRDHEEDDRGELVEEGRDVQHGAEGGGHNLLSRVRITEMHSLDDMQLSKESCIICLLGKQE